MSLGFGGLPLGFAGMSMSLGFAGVSMSLGFAGVPMSLGFGGLPLDFAGVCHAYNTVRFCKSGVGFLILIFTINLSAECTVTFTSSEMDTT